MKKTLLTLALVAMAALGAKATTAADLAGTYNVTFYGDQWYFYNYDSNYMDYFEFSQEEGNQYTVEVTAVGDDTIIITNFFGVSETCAEISIEDCIMVGTYDAETGVITFPVSEFGLYYPYPDDYPDYCYYNYTICAWDEAFDLFAAPDGDVQPFTATVDGDTITFDEFGVVDLMWADYGWSSSYVWGESYTMVKDAAGINSIAIDNTLTDNRIYNLQGIQVDSNYKGLVIKNGKKYLQK